MKGAEEEVQRDDGDKVYPSKACIQFPPNRLYHLILPPPNNAIKLCSWQWVDPLMKAEPLLTRATAGDQAFNPSVLEGYFTSKP